MPIFNKNKDKKSGLALGCKSVEEMASKIATEFKSDGIIKSIETTDNGFLRINICDEVYINNINSILQNGLNVK